MCTLLVKDGIGVMSMRIAALDAPATPVDLPADVGPHAYVRPDSPADTRCVYRPLHSSALCGRYALHALHRSGYDSDATPHSPGE